MHVVKIATSYLLTIFNDILVWVCRLCFYVFILISSLKRARSSSHPFRHWCCNFRDVACGPERSVFMALQVLVCSAIHPQGVSSLFCFFYIEFFSPFIIDL